MARVGSAEVEAGGDFTLHAVLEARTWDGKPLYYTEAERLELPEGEVDIDRIERFPGRTEAKVLWFSVEARKPFLEVSSPEELEALEFDQFFLPDWPRSWAVSGKWGATSAGVTLPEGVEGLPFGTRRFHVRIELFGPESKIRPRETFKSWGGKELREKVALFPTVNSALPGRLGPASRAFGLPQIEKAKDASESAATAVRSWLQANIAFSRLVVIKATLVAAGTDAKGLEWRAIELTGDQSWRSGDLLRVGERWVITYDDRGEIGKLDYDDLCFDFDKGAAVRRLGDIFVGEGLVERAHLGS